MSTPVFHHEVENRPLRAEHGRLTVTGWCLLAGAEHSPDVRLVVGEKNFPIAARRRREDVQQAMSAPATAADCGFEIPLQLSPGARLARLEAASGPGQWQVLQRFTLTSTPGVLHAVVEKPPGNAPVVRSLRVEGWCAHPDYELARVALHYGDQRLACEHGLPRKDVPQLVPRSPDAARAGFIAIKNIPVGYGPLRLKGVMKTGEVCFAHTSTLVDVDVDEDHRKPVDLRAPRPELGPARRALPPTPPAPAGEPLRVLFALYGDFTSNSAIHVVNLANQLAALGHRCTVAVADHVETAKHFPERHFAVADHAAVLAGGERFDVVHAWTTRENVRRFCAALRAAGRARAVVVHLEDNEPRILELTLGRPLADLLALPPDKLDALVPPTLSHPVRSREFLAGAAGATVILDALRAHVPAGKPVHLVWPAADAARFFPRPRPVEFRRALGWADDHLVLCYHGNVHASNRAEVRELYAAVLELNRRGHPCTLLRLGRDACEFLDGVPAEVHRHVVNLGLLERHDFLPVLLSLADFFVQPGEADAFNDFRFPSKLPEFFALGRPVILPRTNLGRLVKHGAEAWVLDRADAAGIAAAVLALAADPALAARLAAGATDFARAHFDWARSARDLAEFYRGVVAAC